MNENDIKGLLPKVVISFKKYGRFDKGKDEITKEIAKNLLSQERLDLLVDEMNFYFVAGMTLYDEVSNIVYSGGKRGEK